VVNKNVREVHSKPLLLHTTDLLMQCDIKTHCVVSTDGTPIKRIVESSVDYVHDRPTELASDTAARWPVLIDVVEAAEKKFGVQYDYVFDFLGTAPIRRLEDIQACFELVKQEGVDNVITAVLSHRNPYFNMVEMDGSATHPKIVCKPKKEVTRRQDAPDTYDMNGSIYAWKRASLFKSSVLLTERTRLHIMPEYTSVDIDTEQDFDYLEFLMKKYDFFK
jgi:CMP-N,N'-diacetyllegionaminic acid synthase